MESDSNHANGNHSGENVHNASWGHGRQPGGGELAPSGKSKFEKIIWKIQNE